MSSARICLLPVWHYASRSENCKEGMAALREKRKSIF